MVLTVHTVEDARNAPEYIATKFPDSKMIFAYDQALTSTIDKYFTLLGGSSSYPRTVIVDEDGVIVYTVDGPPANTAKDGPEAVYNKLVSIIDETKNN